MRNRYVGVWVLALGLVLAALAPAAEETFPAGTAKIEIDRAPAFAFLGWEKQVQAEGGAMRVRAPDGRGGAGYHIPRDLSAFGDRTPAIVVVPGAASKAKAMRLHIQDADGTEHQFAFRLEGLAAGAAATVLADDGASLRVPNQVGPAGKEAGFDLARVANFVFTGDWTPEPVDLVVRRIEFVEPDAKVLKAREALKARNAAAVEAQRKAEEAKANRKKELLAGAPHPADGPDIRHIALVAPDTLDLVIQEKEFVPVPQIPYEPKPGDEIRHVGKDKLLVIEDGKIQEQPLDVVVVRKENGKETTLGHLAVNAGRLKPDDQTRGQALSDETVAEPEAYRIVGVDDPAWKEPLAPAAVSWKRKPNAMHSVAHQADVFLKLPRPLVEGKTYRIECPGVNMRQASVTYRHEPATVRSPAVHVTAIGFRPDDPFKRAYLSEWLGTGGPVHYADGLKFRVLDDATGRPVFEGAVRLLKAGDARETFKEGRNYEKTDVLAMDFGAVKTPGRYRVSVDGIGCSYPFPIAEDAWTIGFRLSMKGLLHERSGIALGPPFTDYVRPRNMHPADGVKVFASAGSQFEAEGGQDGIFKMLAEKRTDKLLPDAWGGHMDAGDWDRNLAHPAAMWNLVELYELFPEKIGAVKLALPPAEAQNAIPDILDEVLWNLELYRRLQSPEGGVGGGIESTSHPRPGEGSWQESLYLSAYAPDPQASFIYAGTAAKLSRALDASDKKLADAYAASARKAYDWAVAHQAEFLGRLDEKARAAREADFRDGRNLAAFELWRRTGEQKFHDAFRETTLLTVPYGEVLRQRKAAVSYARLPDGQGDAALRDAARKWVVKVADESLAFGDGNAFGITMAVPLPPIGFVGYFSTPETCVGPLLPYAWLLTHDEKYLAGAIRACLYAAGANPDNRALTTGLGPDPVRFPLHIDSWVTGQPAPAGITVYGITDPAENSPIDGWAHTWFLQRMVPGSRTWPATESYWDIYLIPSSNEFTIHQTIIPTAFYWGFLAVRPAR